MSNDSLYLTKNSGIAEIALNRPDKLNALNAARLARHHWQGIIGLFARVGADDEVKVVILCASAPPMMQSPI